MYESSIKRAIIPLRMIFWGGLLCIFDFTLYQTTTYNYVHISYTEGFKFDILSDALGAFLIAVAVFRLATIPVHDRYAKVMKLLKIVSVLAVLDAIRDHFIIPLPEEFQLTLKLFNLITLIATVTFCVAMRWLCEEAQLHKAAQSWRLTTALFIIFGVAGFLLPLSLVIPFIHLFISTSRMKHAALRYWSWGVRARNMGAASDSHRSRPRDMSL
jgi:hypothetical protein